MDPRSHAGGGPVKAWGTPPRQGRPTSPRQVLERQARAAQRVEAVGASGTEEASLLLARNEAFEGFRRSYRKNEAIEASKQELKGKYDAAKRLGEHVNGARARINAAKGQMESVRQKRAAAELSGSAGGLVQEEESLKEMLEDEKRQYKEGFAQLKALKSEIEHLQHLLEQSRRRLQGDFEKWFATQGEGEEAVPLPSHAAPGGGGGSSRGTPLPSPQRQAAGAQQQQQLQQQGQQQGQGHIVSERMMGPPPLTGNEEVDQEIMAFYKAREKLVHDRMARAQ